MIIFLLSCAMGLKNEIIPLDTGDEIVDQERDTGLMDTATEAPELPEETEEPTDTEEQDTEWQDTGDTDDTDSPVDPNTQDNDGDGYSIEEGDCNDNNPNIHPFNFDGCDGIDEDCDGLIDEDGPQDAYEPNESQQQYYDLEPEIILAEQAGINEIIIEGVTSSATDYDYFQFYLEDGWFDSFGIETELHAISLTTDFAVELWLILNEEGDGPELLYTANDNGNGLGESGSFSGTWLYGDSGTYQVVVYAVSGASCEAEYQLDIAF